MIACKTCTLHRVAMQILPNKADLCQCLCPNAQLSGLTSNPSTLYNKSIQLTYCKKPTRCVTIIFNIHLTFH